MIVFSFCNPKLVYMTLLPIPNSVILLYTVL